VTVLVTVNGADTELADDTTVAALVGTLTTDRRRIAVALGGEVVPRSAWESTVLRPGDAIEVLTAVAGG
jgi:sulfur carrier protein